MTTILPTLLVFGILVFIHELGHFSVAKLVGVRVYEFSIGFGTKLAAIRRGETLYSIRAFPLGGFVNMAGMDQEMDKREAMKLLEEEYKKKKWPYTQELLEEKAEVEKERLFSKKPVWARMAVIVAGPFMNFVLAAALFAILFISQGEPTNIIGSVREGQPAAKAGLTAGDKIVNINGENITSWEEVISEIGKNKNKEPLNITVLRNGQEKNFLVTPEYVESEKRSIIGIETKKIRPGAIKAVGIGIKQTYQLSIELFSFLKKMFTGQAPMDIGGPVRITWEIGKVAETGFLKLLGVTGFFSLQLAILNLLPIPALDGSRLIFLAWEGVRGKPVRPERENFIHFIGFVFLLLIMAVVTYRDIVQLFFTKGR